jgi:hypothetical protein
MQVRHLKCEKLAEWQCGDGDGESTPDANINSILPALNDFQEKIVF